MHRTFRKPRSPVIHEVAAAAPHSDSHALFRSHHESDRVPLVNMSRGVVHAGSCSSSIGEHLYSSHAHLSSSSSLTNTAHSNGNNNSSQIRWKRKRDDLLLENSLEFTAASSSNAVQGESGHLGGLWRAGNKHGLDVSSNSEV